MNKEIDEKSGMPSADDASVIVGFLWQRGVIRTNCDDLQCKRKMIELGLTLPDGKSRCLSYGREGDAAFYLFVFVPDSGSDSDSDRRTAGSGFTGFRFDIARYRSNPLPGIGRLGEAFLAFMGAVATLVGFDLAHCTLVRERPGRN